MNLLWLQQTMRIKSYINPSNKLSIHPRRRERIAERRRLIDLEVLSLEEGFTFDEGAKNELVS
jgi:hypothetical protein